MAVLYGTGGTFCAGYDLKETADGAQNESLAQSDNFNPFNNNGAGPLGPTRRFFSKPVIAAVSGYAVAGGFELALACDLRVVEESSVFGVFCRRFGVPLIDGGTGVQNRGTVSIEAMGVIKIDIFNLKKCSSLTGINWSEPSSGHYFNRKTGSSQRSLRTWTGESGCETRKR